jgi:hypothetical protein
VIPPLKSAGTPAAAPPDEPAPASIKSPEGIADWNKLRSEAQTLRTQKAELEKMLEVRSKASPEVETLRKQNQELSERVRILNVEQHPQFQAYFGNKTAEAIAIARSAAGVGKAEEVTRILQLPDSDYRAEQIDALIADLPVSRQTRVLSALTQLDSINAERTAAIDRAKRDGVSVQQQQQQAAQEHQAKMNQIFEATVKDAIENVGAFQPREGDEAWNSEIPQRVATAKYILFGNATPEEQATAAIWAASAPVLQQMVLQAQDEISALKVENAKLRSSTPSPSAGGEAAPTTEEPGSYLEAITKSAQAAGPGIFRGGR